jgi:serine/threonine protein kinase
MPWLLGTLEDDLTKSPVLSDETALTIGVQTTLALRYAYSEHNIVHLDLKPANLLIKERNPLKVQISDWGISRIASSIAHANWRKTDSDSQLTSYGAGTPLYMAPERFTGKWKISPRADIYSLGMLLLQIVTGDLPFNLVNGNPFEEIMSGSYMRRAMMMLDRSCSALAGPILQCINPNERDRLASYDDLILALTRTW